MARRGGAQVMGHRVGEGFQLFIGGCKLGCTFDYRLFQMMAQCFQLDVRLLALSDVGIYAGQPVGLPMIVGEQGTAHRHPTHRSIIANDLMVKPQDIHRLCLGQKGLHLSMDLDTHVRMNKGKIALIGTIETLCGSAENQKGFQATRRCDPG